MITTVLIDLDDTLLRNHDDRFIPSYVERLSRHLSPLKPANLVSDQLYQGTLAMQANDDPERVLLDVFDENFYPALNLVKKDAQPFVESFFKDEHPKLRDLTGIYPDAQALIQHAIGNELEVVIATNPLYPLDAIKQRLEWAGIPVGSFHYEFITSCENSHFTKPHLEYYAEILAKLGRNPQDAAMIGNDYDFDIEPARKLGMSVFHVTENGKMSTPGGSLESALPWLIDPPDIRNPLDSTTPETLMARLRGNLAAFHHLLHRYDPDQWNKRPSPDSWAVVEVLAHLRDVEQEINLPRIDTVLTIDEPFLSSMHSDQWAEERGYLGQDPLETLSELRQARRNTIASLLEISDAQWHRHARHAIFGPTNLLELVLIFLDHDLLHLRQLNSIFDSL
jgi:FMN phosphatase YigB (HAD superfamily)